MSWVFLRAGYDVLLHPERPATTAGPLLATVRARVPVSLPDDVTVVRINAGIQMAAAAALALGSRRRAAAALFASLLPTTLAGHAFWKVDDPSQRPNQRNHFNKNLALMGALVIVWLESGRPPMST
jgi:putative oxidoreductase